MKRIVFLMALGWLAIGARAQQLTEQEAKERALQYLSAKAPAKARGLASSRLKSAKVGAEKIYAFNREGGGYVIASGDSRTLPVLGYSDSGSIDWDQMPANMQAWLKQYDEAIATLGDRTDFKDGNQMISGSLSRATTRSDRAPVEPLIKTQWNQAAPYWNKTPLYDGADTSLLGQHCYTGCVATSMAQIMNYYQWPKTACEPIPEYEYETVYENKTKTVHIDALPATTFDWGNMIANYQGPDGIVLGTEAQQEAVATLMRYCGQSVYMGYTSRLSGGDPRWIAQALVKYFGYAAATNVERRFSTYNIDEWDGLIYGELAAGRPVFYGGYSAFLGGHSFVCDGYDGNGLFHINWGWSGSKDGYFSLSVLNPYKSTGFGSNVGFATEHKTVIYTDPMMEKQPLPQGSLPICRQLQSLSLEKNVVRMYYYLYENEDKVGDHALGTIDANGQATPVFFGDPNDSIISHLNYLTYLLNNFLVEIDSTVFQPGDSMTLYPMNRYREPGAEWKVISPLASHIVAGCTDEGRFFMTVHGPIFPLECTGSAITKGTGRINERCDLTITLKNHSDYDFEDLLSFLPLYYGHIQPEDITSDTSYTMGEEILCNAYLKCGQETDFTLTFIPQQDGLVRFVIANEWSEFIESFTMEFGDPSSINAVNAATASTGYYDLHGRRLQGPPSRKGIYIRGNKKVIN